MIVLPSVDICLFNSLHIKACPENFNTVLRTPMPRRSLLSARARADLFDIPADPDGLIRHYLLLPSDLDLIRTRRRDENRLGLAVHFSLLRHPGQGWRDGVVLPDALLEWLGDQQNCAAPEHQASQRLGNLKMFPHRSFLE
jgi:hypothetical protein